MATRPLFGLVIKDLLTTSDKIRALARAGYLRTEISKLLDIRYQHVRKVLTDAGIEDGIQRPSMLRPSTQTKKTERPPTATPPSRTPSSFLIEAGFQLLGEWQSKGEKGFMLSQTAPVDPGVYAFIVDDVVCYVGLTQRGFRARMSNYRLGHERQRTSARVNALISSTLAQGKTVSVLIATPSPLAWNGLPVNTAAGLEAGLIRMIRPEWNMLGAGK